MQASEGHQSSSHLFIPKLKFIPDKDPDPVKRRRKNIKKLRGILKPKRSFPLFFLPAFNAPGQCCVSGANLRELPHDAYDKLLLDPETFQPIEGRTLISEFFTDPINGQPTTFTAMSNITGGYPLYSSYAPDFLQMYWLLTQWTSAEENEKQSNNGKYLKKRGISMKVIPIMSRKKSKPALVQQFEPLFELAVQYEGKGCHIYQYRNPLTDEVDLATITLDLRVMRLQESEDLSEVVPSPDGGEQ